VSIFFCSQSLQKVSVTIAKKGEKLVEASKRKIFVHFSPEKIHLRKQKLRWRRRENSRASKKDGERVL
jgi:hypothetical protein